VLPSFQAKIATAFSVTFVWVCACTSRLRVQQLILAATVRAEFRRNRTLTDPSLIDKEVQQCIHSVKYMQSYIGLGKGSSSVRVDLS